MEGCARCEQRKEADKPWGRKVERLRFYGTARWQKLRRVKLAENPECEGCKNALAAEVDHIISATANRPDLWYKWENLQSLCVDCHKEKTAQASVASRRV